MPNDDQLSPEDLTALMQVRAGMEPSDPRGPKIDAFIKSQLQNFVPDANAQAKASLPQPQTQEGFSDFLARTQKNSYLTASPTGIATSPLIPAKTQGAVIGAGLGGLAVEGGAAGLPFALRALGTSSGAGLGAGAGTLAGGGSPQEALGTAATTTGVGMALSPVAKFIQDLAGKAKAGPLFQAVNEAAGQNHVETSGMLQAAQEAQKLKQAGFGQMPQVLTKFLTRMKSGEPLTFEDARLIEQAAGGKLSQAEAANMRPQMYAKLAQFADQARKATMQAAGQSGVDTTFADALNSYKAGAAAQEKVEFSKNVMLELLKKAAAGGAAGAGGTAAGYATYKALHK